MQLCRFCVGDMAATSEDLVQDLWLDTFHHTMNRSQLMVNHSTSMLTQQVTSVAYVYIVIVLLCIASFEFV